MLLSNYFPSFPHRCLLKSTAAVDGEKNQVNDKKKKDRSDKKAIKLRACLTAWTSPWTSSERDVLYYSHHCGFAARDEMQSSHANSVLKCAAVFEKQR